MTACRFFSCSLWMLSVFSADSFSTIFSLCMYCVLRNLRSAFSCSSFLVVSFRPEIVIICFNVYYSNVYYVDWNLMKPLICFIQNSCNETTLYLFQLVVSFMYLFLHEQNSKHLLPWLPVTTWIGFWWVSFHSRDFVNMAIFKVEVLNLFFFWTGLRLTNLSVLKTTSNLTCNQWKSQL